MAGAARGTAKCEMCMRSRKGESHGAVVMCEGGIAFVEEKEVVMW